jgi:transposase
MNDFQRLILKANYLTKSKPELVQMTGLSRDSVKQWVRAEVTTP